jgi:hypothetical protein
MQTEVGDARGRDRQAVAAARLYARRLNPLQFRKLRTTLAGGAEGLKQHQESGC